MWLRKAANGKEENFAAFQGKKRILYYIIQITSVLLLMIYLVSILVSCFLVLFSALFRIAAA